MLPSIVHSGKMQTVIPIITQSYISSSAQLQSASSLSCGQSAALLQYSFVGTHILLSSVHLFTIDLLLKSNFLYPITSISWCKAHLKKFSSPFIISSKEIHPAITSMPNNRTIFTLDSMDKELAII